MIIGRKIILQPVQQRIAFTAGCRFLVQLYAGMSAPGFFNLFIGVVTALLAVLGIVYFFVTERILRRHLNLE